MCQEFSQLSAPLGMLLGPAGLVPFDTYSLAFKFEWIVNESETNFELYIKSENSLAGICRDLSMETSISLHTNGGRRQR